MAPELILNIALSAVVFAVIIGSLVWAMFTQHRDRPHVFAGGARRRRRGWSRHLRPQVGRPRVAGGYGGEARPAS
jgi:hypothetical protein